MNEAISPLQEEAALFRDALNLSINGITLYRCIRDDFGKVTDFRIITMNRAAERLHGLEAAKLVGKRVTDVYPPIRQHANWQYATQVADTGKSIQKTVYHTFPTSGYSGWFELVVQPCGDGVAFSYHELTGLFEANLRLQDQANLLGRILDNAACGLVGLRAVRDASGTVVDLRYRFINRTALQDTFRTQGEAPPDITDHSILTYFPTLVNTPLWQTYVTALNTQEAQRLETQYDQDGFQVCFDLAATPIGDELVLSYNETTRTRQLARELDQQNAEISHQAHLFDQVLDNMLHGLLILRAIRDEAGGLADVEYVRVSRAVERDSQLTTQDFIGRRMLDLYPGADQAEFWQHYRTVLRTGEPQRFETHYVGNGKDIWMDISLSLLDPDTILSCYEVITDKKRYHQQLEEHNRDLKRSNDNLQQFAYVASHDLQEPLRKIRAFGDVLQQQFAPKLGGDGAELIARMQGSAMRMQFLVQDLLNFSRLTSERPASASIDLNALIEQILVEIGDEIQRQQARIEHHPLPTVRGDRSQLLQLFLNLLSNAVKFHAPGAKPEVVIRGRSVDASAIPGLSPSSQMRYICIEVEDNGIGFDETYLNRIFTIFQRLHSRNQYPGTGIGLAISKKVVENHGGFLTARSHPGKGATFSVYLPD